MLETCHLDSTSHNGRRGRFQTCPATKLIIKQKTASPIISDAWKKHKQVCAGKLPNGENINMRKQIQIELFISFNHHAHSPDS